MKNLACLCCIFVGFAGCATTPRQPALMLTGDIMVDGPNAIARGPARDKVLWQYRTAAAAMRHGQFQMAKELLDDALLTLGGIYGKDKSARKARGYFRGEEVKTFIGEPYERAMAYYYRGILYWMDGEPDNARACFRSAQLQDTGTEDEQFTADYVLLDYLDGFATTKLAGDGTDQLERARTEARMFRPPPYLPKANVLCFVEFGPGPAKYATGQYGEQLRFRANPSPVHSAAIKISDISVPAAPYDDLEFQATTRGGRVMDHVLANKAVFKSTTGAVGDAAILSGAVLASGHHRHSNQDEIGLGLLVAGLIGKIFSETTVPAADIRSWDNLPRYLSFAHLVLPPGQHVATVEFQDKEGKVLPNFTKTITINVLADGSDKVIFVSDQSLTPQTL